jgi:hypothetical protein
MSKNKLHKLTIYFVSLYIGLIVTDCAQRIMLSLVRHGFMSWREYLYDSKIILVAAIYFSYQHLKPALSATHVNFYVNLLRNNLLLFTIVIIANRLVFTQFPSFYNVYISPLRLLFFVW